MEQENIHPNYLTKLLSKIEKHPELFKRKDLGFIVGLQKSQINDLKKYALTNNLIKSVKGTYYLLESGKKFMEEHPYINWCKEHNTKRPDVNLEYLKLEKAPPTLTRAIKLLALHYLNGEEIKENSTEYFLIKELLCPKSEFSVIKKEIEQFLINDKKVNLNCVFEYFMNIPYGLTKSIVSVLLLDVLARNKDILAIYENCQFRLELDHNMFDRMLYYPERFEVQKTVLDEFKVLEEISQDILPGKTYNVLHLTKGLMNYVFNLDKYTLSSENLSYKAIRFRNAVKNAKDPIDLFYKDIPKILCDKLLCQCNNDFVVEFNFVLAELQGNYTKLVNDLKTFLLVAFCCSDKKSLLKRFENLREYISDDDLKAIYYNLKKAVTSENRWVERIATIINGAKVPQDWNDKDLSQFKLKIKELSAQLDILECTVGEDEHLDQGMSNVLNLMLQLPKSKQRAIIRRVVNG